MSEKEYLPVLLHWLQANEVWDERGATGKYEWFSLLVEQA